jgi:hypothetical protein
MVSKNGEIKMSLMKKVRDAIDEVDCDHFYGEVESKLEDNGLKAKLVYENAWGEGQMEDIEYVIKVSNINETESIFVMLEGWYASYDGSNFDGNYKEVFPYEITETRYK